MDVRDPTQPVVVGRCKEGGGRDLYISNNHAYILSFWLGLLVVNIADPAAPVIVNQVLLPSDVNATSIYVTGDFALLGSMPHGSGGSLLFFDISDPLDVQQVGEMALTVSDIRVQDNLAYVQ